MPLEAPGLVSFLGCAVSKSTQVNHISPLDRHHPTETLETVRFGVSNVPRGLLGPEISQVEGWPVVKNVTRISPEFHENKIILQLT